MSSQWMVTKWASRMFPMQWHFTTGKSSQQSKFTKCCLHTNIYSGIVTKIHVGLGLTVARVIQCIARFIVPMITVVSLGGGLDVVWKFFPLAISVGTKWKKNIITWAGTLLGLRGWGVLAHIEVLPQPPSSWYLWTEEASFELFI